MNAAVEKALVLWGMEGASYQLIAARENQVFRVETGSGTYALRLHRKGYRSNAELRSELQWMDVVAQGGVHVPIPILSQNGDFLQIVEDLQVDILSWLEGSPIGKTGEDLQASDRTGLFREIGRQMARLHEISDAWEPPDGFTRCTWDRAGLLGETPLWGRFWENPTLSDADRELFQRLRRQLDLELKQIDGSLDFGLIHADLVRENVLVDNGRLQLIDFDDGGFGFRLFDLATTLFKNLDEPDYPELRAALLDGYLSVREIDHLALDLFIVLRSATYVGWIIERMDEDSSEIRNARFVQKTRMLAQEYLAKSEGRH